MKVLMLMAMWSATLGTQAVVPAAAPSGPPAAPTSVSSAPRTGYVWPLRPDPAVVRPFIAPSQKWAAGHRGVDLLSSTDARVHAAGDGVVSFSGVIAGRGTVAVTHRNGWRTTYEPLATRVQQGATVSAGDLIGTLTPEASHCAPRACLHWGLVIGDRNYRDPLMLLKPQRVVLLPVP
ncbi:M23 family metallopeptidase [Yimella sp. cx-51]|uniref:M23 family metallopeptidase n=1 Tax=Yimella sp. cx-51 TaxID=2770551 RepID=UPI00165E09A8|nr:M23 family metallopeptidase [Yimella sp. cx-51]MBC9956783.1 M23 family metallopeptidase [Yimella sp. cx-51]QTH39013.1 M23 family metallopeptidase [Yimella sp. cx-51]